MAEDDTVSLNICEANVGKSLAAHGSSVPPLPKILALELEVRGHHADYIRNFATVWIQNDIPARIDFLVTRPFLKYHKNIVEHFEALNDPRVSLTFLTESEQTLLDRNPRLKYWHGWNLFCQYAKLLRADHGLLMYSDYFQVPICIGKRSPCSFSAIYFRPTFHYSTFQNYLPSWKRRFTAWRKEWLLAQVLKTKELKEVYCLDSLVIPYLRAKHATHTRISHLADSFSMTRSSKQRADQLRAELGIEPNRRIYCLLGVLDSRKGPHQLLEAVQHISPMLGAEICILLLGYLPDASAAEIEALALRANGVSNVQVILRNQYIESIDVQNYYAMSDVILTTYQNHMGSSSALIRAALAQKPVLSSNYGLMGELVSRRNLGMVVDSTDPMAIAKGIEMMANMKLETMLDKYQAELLVRENSQEQLGKDLKRLLDHLPRSALPTMANPCVPSQGSTA